jgi:glycosyltransferase involved in cell wall biosynthesis
MRIMLLNAPFELVRSMALPQHDILALDIEPVVRLNLQCGPRCEFRTFEPRSKVDPLAIAGLRKTIRDFSPDIVHAFMPRGLAIAVLATYALREPPPILSFRGIIRVPSRWDPSNHITVFSPRVAIHACESNAVRDGLVRGGVAAERCETVYNCVRAESLPRLGRAGLAPFGVARKAFVVGTVAAVRPVKGIDILVRAATECADLPDLSVLVMGPVRDTSVVKLADDPRIRGRVHFSGTVPGAAAFMDGFDVFAMPSRQEGLCRALLEAMSQRVCPVVSDAGGMKELVRNGVEGLVFPSEDHHALADVLRQLYHDRNRLRAYGEAAGVRVQEMCSPERMRDRILTMYDRVLGQSNLATAAAA